MKCSYFCGHNSATKIAPDRTNHYFSTAESAVDYKAHEKQDANTPLSAGLALVWDKAGPFDLRTNKKALISEIRTFDQPSFKES